MVKTNVVFMTYPRNREKPTKIKIGTWSEQQKIDFLNQVLAHTGLYFNDRCSFNVHFDKSIIHSCAFKKSILFTPTRSKNKKNELIIEVIPDIEILNCSVSQCSRWIQNGGCQSWFIQKYIGKTLFPNIYAKQR